MLAFLAFLIGGDEENRTLVRQLISIDNYLKIMAHSDDCSNVIIYILNIMYSIVILK